MKKWTCTRCGACCRHVGRVPILAKYADESGACKFLDKDNLCTVYEKRPPVCNVAWVYEHFFKGHVSEEEFYARTQEACEALQRE